MHRFALALAAAVALAGAAAAQQQHGGHGAPPPSAGPYRGLERRAIAALSDEQIADLRAGRGMGLALAAELNGYPGPIHVLELAEPLGLTEDQRSRVQALHAAMKAEAVPLGERLIGQEADLEAAFRERTVTRANLAEKTAAIAATQGALRHAHLKYHLATVEILSPEQVGRYGTLRGYAHR
jgi:LTXXQ motif family protein